MSTIDRLASADAGTHRTSLGALGLGGTVVALAVTGGPAGIPAGIGLLLVGLAAPPVVAFGLGQAMLLVVLPAPTAARLALVQGTLFLLLLDATTRWRGVWFPVQLLYATVRLRSADGRRFVPDALPGLVAFGALGGLTWVAATRVGLLEAAAGLVVGVGVVGYVVHRYERVVLGLAGEERAGTASPDADEIGGGEPA